MRFWNFLRLLILDITSEILDWSLPGDGEGLCGASESEILGETCGEGVCAQLKSEGEATRGGVDLVYE
jgi:hypothetical protein